MGKQHPGRRRQCRGERLVAAGPVGAEIPGGGLDGGDGGSDRAVVGVHAVHERGRIGIRLHDPGIQASVLGLVVMVQEVRHPQQVVGQCGAVGLRPRLRGTGDPDALEIAAQGGMHDARDSGVGGSVGIGVHDGSGNRRESKTDIDGVFGGER